MTTSKRKTTATKPALKKAKDVKPAKQRTEGKDPATGHFLPGNQWWLARSSHGPKPKFATAEALWSACLEYFQYAQDNPLQEEKIFHNNGEITRTTVSRMRAMTLNGLSLFLDVDYTTWDEWRTARPDLSHVIRKVEKSIHDQKFSGAACDLLNANIIARDLGLVDKQEKKVESKTEVTVVDGGAVIDAALARALGAKE